MELCKLQKDSIGHLEMIKFKVKYFKLQKNSTSVGYLGMIKCKMKQSYANPQEFCLSWEEKSRKCNLEYAVDIQLRLLHLLLEDKELSLGEYCLIQSNKMGIQQ